MFKKDTKYWITIKTNYNSHINLLGKVIDENNFMIKVLREKTDKYPEKEELLMLSEIIKINEVKEGK